MIHTLDPVSPPRSQKIQPQELADESVLLSDEPARQSAFGVCAPTAKKALDSVSSAGTNLPKASTLQPDSIRKKKAPKKTSTVHNGLCCFVATADTVDMCRHTVVRDRFFRK